LLGVRPENFQVASAEFPGGLPAEVYVAEALGNETLIRLHLGSQELVARTDADYEPEVGAQVWVRPDMGRAHLFDVHSEQRLV
jgi:ABC-type sugar transport system ATPase subunit